MGRRLQRGTLCDHNRIGNNDETNQKIYHRKKNEEGREGSVETERADVGSEAGKKDARERWRVPERRQDWL